MATIELYKSKVNNMSSYLQQARTAVNEYCGDLTALKTKILGINSSVCDNAISRISTSSRTQEQQVAGLETTQKQVNEFVDLAVNRDNSAAVEICKKKNDFYKKYSYLKPESEKTRWEKFRSKLKKAAEWCKEHWKEIVLAIELVVAVVCLFVPGLQGVGTAMLIGALKGAITGGLMGGITSALSGGSFIDGFIDGAVDGAMAGALSGGLGELGTMLGKSVRCGSKLGKAIKTTAKVTGTINNGLDIFDQLSFGFGLLLPDNPLTTFHDKVEQNVVYQGFKTGVGYVSEFTGSASEVMACFVAGTLVLTPNGLIEIEKLNPGDRVLAANEFTFDIAAKNILKTFRREVTTLVHLKVNNEEIVTTENHPFYIEKRGFIEAGKLLIGDKLITSMGETIEIEDCYIENTEQPVYVYNIKVEEYHTYFVGNCKVWVHNTDCVIVFNNKSGLDEKNYSNQLEAQEQGLNELTIDQYLENRRAYNERSTTTGNGRDPGSVKFQKEARQKAILERMQENINSGMEKDAARKEAKEWASGLAALHGPDQIAGGFADNITGLGDASINSSIGSQWKADSRIGALDEYVKSLSEKFPGDTKLGDPKIKSKIILKLNK